MIIGIGTDICDIRRIEQSIEKYGERFLNKTFTEGEQAYCDCKARPAMSYDETGALSWTSVEVQNDPSGRPTVVLYKDAKARSVLRCPEGYGINIHLSLSDDYPYATAFAIAEAIPVVR